MRVAKDTAGRGREPLADCSRRFRAALCDQELPASGEEQGAEHRGPGRPVMRAEGGYCAVWSHQHSEKRAPSISRNAAGKRAAIRGDLAALDV